MGLPETVRHAERKGSAQIGVKIPSKVNNKQFPVKSQVFYVHKDEAPMLIVHGTDDKLAPYEQAEELADAMDRVKARYYFHSVIGGGHNPYFGLGVDLKTGNFDVGGGGVGLFEDPAVEPLIIAFLRHYLLDRRTDVFAGPG